MFQSTFPQGERRPQIAKEDQARGVSIHVPARGTTTPDGNDSVHAHTCFNPRSRKGNDHCLCTSTRSVLCFNPRSRKGNDTVRSASSSIAFRFQSTFPQGERLLVVAEIIKAAIGFNPRSRKGNDIFKVGKLIKKDGFNPRSRKGNDLPLDYLRLLLIRFQSTFPQGERPHDLIN